MKKIIVLSICFLLVGSVWGQSKKEIKNNKIKSTTIWETKYEEGKPVTYKSSYQEYDRDGHCILNIEYSPTKVVLRKQTARYDANKNKIEETEFDLLKKKNTRRTSKFNAFKDKTEEVEYDNSGVILQKITYSYDGDGNRVMETVFDPLGKIIRKSLFAYNGQNLKVTKETVSGTNTPISGKKWEYVLY